MIIKAFKQKKQAKGRPMEAEDAQEAMKFELIARQQEFMTQMNQMNQMHGWNAFPYFIPPNLEATAKDKDAELPLMAPKTPKTQRASQVPQTQDMQRYQPYAYPNNFRPFANPYQMNGFMPVAGYPGFPVPGENSLPPTTDVGMASESVTLPAKSQRKKKERTDDEDESPPMNQRKERREDNVEKREKARDINDAAKKFRDDDSPPSKGREKGRDEEGSPSPKERKERIREEEFLSSKEKKEKIRDEDSTPKERKKKREEGQGKKDQAKDDRVPPKALQLLEETPEPAEHAGVAPKRLSAENKDTELSQPFQISQPSPQTQPAFITIAPPLIAPPPTILSVGENERVAAIYALGILDSGDQPRVLQPN
jgi:hypothetical protein